MIINLINKITKDIYSLNIEKLLEIGEFIEKVEKVNIFMDIEKKAGSMRRAKKKIDLIPEIIPSVSGSE